MPGYFIIFLTDDKELYGLPGTVHYLIQNKTANVQSYITVNHLLPIFQHKITGRNDNQVTDQHYTPQSDIPVFIDAMISVPPVLPLEEKAMPMPPPQRDAPMTHAMKG